MFSIFHGSIVINTGFTFLLRLLPICINPSLAEFSSVKVLQGIIISLYLSILLSFRYLHPIKFFLWVLNKQDSIIAWTFLLLQSWHWVNFVLSFPPSLLI